MTFAKGHANKPMSESPKGTPLTIPNVLDTFSSIAREPQRAAVADDPLDESALTVHMMSCRKVGCLTCA